jgi:hypothetical protein
MGAKPRKWTDVATVTKFCIFGNHIGPDLNVVSKLAIAKNRTGTDSAVYANAGGPPQLDICTDDCVGADANVRIDENGLGILDGHALEHQVLIFPGSQNAVRCCQLNAIIDAQ